MIPILWWLGKFGNIVGERGPYVAVLVGAAIWFTDLIDRVVGTGLELVASKLSTVQIDSLMNTSFTALEYIGYINAVVPLSEMLHALEVFFAALLTVIACRWIKSVIPSVSN